MMCQTFDLDSVPEFFVTQPGRSNFVYLLAAGLQVSA